MNKRFKKVLAMVTGVCISASMLAGNTALLLAEDGSDQGVPDIASEQTLSEEDQAKRDEFQGERETGEIITTVDEQGNVSEVEAEDGTSDNEVSPKARSADAILVNFNTKGAQTTDYTEVGTGASGYTCGTYGADAIYLGTDSSGKVKFMLSGAIGLVNASEVQLVNVSGASSMSNYQVKDGRLYHYITTNITKSSYGSTLDNGPAPSYLSAGTVYYSYDGHYFYTRDKLTEMVNDYNNGTRSSAVNPNTPFYNYYQYLPLRSYTTYTGEEISSIISANASSSSKMIGTGELFVAMQDTYGVNALLMAGVAANESAWGMSNICQTKNNLFGLNAVDSSPGESANYYADVATCAKDFAETYMSKQYLNPNNWKYNGGFLGAKSSGINVMYASDPYWGEKAAAIAWRFDKTSGKDANRYQLGVKDPITSNHTNVNVRTSNNTNSTVLFTSGTQASTTYILLTGQNEDGFYRIQSDPVLNAGRNGIDTTTGVYSWSMQAYISALYVTPVNQAAAPNPTPDPEPTPDPTPTPGGMKFTDVSSDGWYYSSVKYVFDKGWMTGMNDTYFGVSEPIGRAQFVTILYRMAGEPDVQYNAIYPDVPNGLFYSKAVMWATQANIATGYGNGYFGSSDMITREQMATMMLRYAEYQGYPINNLANLGNYPDAGTVSSFAQRGMQWCVGNGIIMGENNTYLSPQKPADRAATATIITRLDQNF